MEVPHGMNANESCMIIQKEGHDDDDDMKHLTCANNYSILLLMMCNFVRVWYSKGWESRGNIDTFLLSVCYEINLLMYKKHIEHRLTTHSEPPTKK